MQNSDMITNVDRKSTERQGENMTNTNLLESKIRALGLNDAPFLAGHSTTIFSTKFY